MEKTIVNETADILRRLSPQNQKYFMTLVRLAEAAENGVKKEFSEQEHKTTRERELVQQ